MNKTLPEGWRWVAPDELAAPESHSLGIGPFGSDLKRSDYTDAGVPLVFVRNIRAENFDLDNQPHVSAEKAAQLSAHRVLPGDVLITKMGDPPGDAAVYPARRPEGRMTADCIRLRVDPSKYVPRFVALATIAPAVKSQILSATKGVAQKKVSLGRYRKVRYPIPELDAQKAIVAAIETHFSRLDAAVASLTRAKANVQRARASVLKAAVEGRLVPTEAALARAEGRDYEPASELLARILTERKAAHEAAQEGAKRRKKYKPPVEPETEGMRSLPEGWCWASPEQLAADKRYSLAIGPFGSNLRVPDYRDSGVPLIFVRNVRAGCFAFANDKFVDAAKAKELLAHQCEPGDVLITKMGDPPGDSWVYPRHRPTGIITADVVKLSVDPDLGVPWYLAYATRSPVVHGQMLDRTKGVAQKKISLARFRTLAYPLPPLAEQHRIAAEVDRRLSVLDAIDTTLDANLARCERLRQSILKRAFEGRLVDAAVPTTQLDLFPRQQRTL